ncbi:MAG: DoxX family protein [Armatimonadota bacterium]|nr:DoxX family protein [Armatimonadota bacterium]
MIKANDFALLLLRIALGVVFLVHGGQKLFGWWGGPGLDGFVTGMGSMGVPAPLAYLAVFTEFFGGAALIVGLFSRLAAAGLAVTMGVAMFKVHLANGFLLSNEGGGFEYTFVLLLASVAMLIAGPGRLAIGDLEARVLGRSNN